ncbi:hypothetical protein DSK97_17820 [Mycobacterium tuberculosis]|nr:hypothetical protein CK481_18940 [Mycobacterium tuberculosis]WJH73515.1 hypothetical protein FF951_18960 [Mycobacterium tuberculosis complex sp. N0052]WJH81731.1 hypothetical protein FF953_19000 [Mycobacterium tuberculosis complex sp. N0145]WJH89945.1 hypothetical protein FF955_18995 [Mycobacterium tuberculosis complex sp. N0155]AUS63271.1 hypothetical protein CBG40_18990 [Mycobacterium tuberculosis]
MPAAHWCWGSAFSCRAVRLLLGPLRGPHRRRPNPTVRLLLGPLRGPHRRRTSPAFVCDADRNRSP